MKNVIALMLFLLASAVHAEWTQQDSGTTANLVDVCFVDELHGWAIGNDGSTPVIIATTDGGGTWQQQECPIETIKLNKVFFVNESIGFIASESRINGDTFESLILRTANGGQTWEISVRAPYYYTFRDVFFIDTNVGWVAGRVMGDTSDLWGGCVLSTTDGGVTWDTQLHLPGPDSTLHYCFDAIVFEDEQHGWMLGNEYFAFSPSSTRLYETTDGGENWFVSYTLHNDAVTSKNIYSIHPDTLWVSNTNFWISVNGGNDWTGGTTSLLTSDSAPVSGSKGWIAQYGNDEIAIMHTADGGVTWEKQFAYSSLQFLALDAVSGQFACGVGSSGVVITYNDTSSSVEQVNQPELFTLEPNYPNPFNASTTIAYSLTEDSPVRISLFTATGQRVRTLCERSMSAGRHSVVVDGSDLATGLYVARIEAQGVAKYTRMLLLK